MAKITVNADTESKTFEVLVNGEAQTDVRDVSFCRYPSYEEEGEDELHINIIMSTEDDSGIRITRHLTAKNSKIPGAKPSKTYAGLYELEKSDTATDDICKYFKKIGV